MGSRYSNTLAITVICNAPIEKVWQEIADWQGQGEWMLSTKVWLTSEQSEGVGTSIAAFTGPFYRAYPKFGFLGLLDTMTVTTWTPPIRCDVIHTGKILKGSGSFELEAMTADKCAFHWSETIEINRVLFYLGAPFLWIGVRLSLARFAKLCRTL